MVNGSVVFDRSIPPRGAECVVRRKMYERAFCAMPMRGSGTQDDAIRPGYVPRSSPTGGTGIIGSELNATLVGLGTDGLTMLKCVLLQSARPAYFQSLGQSCTAPPCP
jgi:hypothetical protein